MLACALCTAACDAPPVDDGVIRLAVASSPEALDPRFATSAVAQRLAQLVAAPLFVVGDDLAPVPLLAESLVEEGPTAYLVTLREGARFTDGSPLTARDVAFTFESLFDEGAPSPHASRFESLERVEVVDERRARFVLKRPFAPFPVEVCAVGVVSEAACRGRAAACRNAPVGAGPFRVARAAAGNEEILLEAFPGFVLGPPATERLLVRVVRDGTTRLLEVIRGKTDVVLGDVTPTDVRALQGVEGVRVLRRPGLGYTYLAFNLRGPREGDDEEVALARRALADPRVRRAVAHALDVELIIDAKLAGAAERATGLLPEGHWAKARGTSPIPFDPGRARALLDEAGFPDRGPGLGRFSIRLATTTDRLRRSIALVVADRLRSVGVQVGVDVREWATLYEDIQRGSFDLFSAKWTPVVEPDLLRWIFHSENVPGRGRSGGNRGAFRDPAVDALLDQARVTTDRAARAALYQQVEERLAEQLPYVPLWFEDEVAVVGPAVMDLEVLRTGSFLPLARLRRSGTP